VCQILRLQTSLDASKKLGDRNFLSGWHYLKFFGIDNVPSKPSLNRILNMVDAEAVGVVIIDIMKEAAVGRRCACGWRKRIQKHSTRRNPALRTPNAGGVFERNRSRPRLRSRGRLWHNP
jgi:hypothetical protein